MTFEQYFDKVYGCWLGKCVCGNVGAPFEGMKQKLSLKFDKSMVEDMLPNDDLDLQVLFLDVVEKYGEDFTSAQLAESFYRNCPYAPGEYAYFKKNFQSGIYPPLSGSFNNEVYKNGMGCTIRSELWACLAPKNPKRAVEFCLRDGVLDHCGDGLYGEIFMTALESLAFGESDPTVLIDKAKAFIPSGSRLYGLIEGVSAWVKSGLDYDGVRLNIISEYGSAEATSVFQNVGIILLNLLLGSDNLLASAIETCECGFDTDCTCATLGAIRGIIAGGKKLNEDYDYSRVAYKLGVNVQPRSGLVYDLGEEVAELGALFNKIPHATKKYVGEKFEKASEITCAAEYADGIPAIAFGDKKRVVLRVKNASDRAAALQFVCSYPLKLSLCETEIPAGSTVEKEIFAEVDAAAAYLPMSNPVEVQCGGKTIFRFGFLGAYRFSVYGPFWKNNVEVPQLKEKESYWNYFPAETPAEQMDKIRFYHTNCLARDVTAGEALKRENFLGVLNSYEDIVTLEEHLRFDGQAYYFLRYIFRSARNCETGIQIGYNTALEFYLNGRQLAVNADPTRYTPENSHCFGVPIRKGDNEIVIKIKKSCEITRFSFNFLESGACSNHITEFEIKK